VRHDQRHVGLRRPLIFPDLAEPTVRPVLGLRGGGENGETVLVRTLVWLLGNPLVHAQRVEDLERNRFAMGSLFGKYLFADG
jgi:hypothetical protein